MDIKITLGQHCFGPIAEINDIGFTTLDIDSYDEDVEANKTMLLNLLLENKDKIGNWSELLEILVSAINPEYIEEESSSDVCEQCGNWNDARVYIWRK